MELLGPSKRLLVGQVMGSSALLLCHLPARASSIPYKQNSEEQTQFIGTQCGIFQETVIIFAEQKFSKRLFLFSNSYFVHKGGALHYNTEPH